MSDNSTPQTSETPAAEKQKTPLELVKERQNAQRQNRGAKGAKAGSPESKGGASEAPTSKPMRSSASKQGG